MVAVPVRAQEAIIQAGRRMDQRGWVPATAGNISVLVSGEDGADYVAITRSGGHKGFLDSFSAIGVDLDGRALSEGDRPSAETLLHCAIYREVADARAVLHGHSVAGTVLSMVERGPTITFEGYELFKAFAGQATHDTRLTLPVFDNDQDIARLAGVMRPHLAQAPLGAYIRGHGAYVWAHDMPSCLARLEALEFLLDCELARRRLAGPREEMRS